MIVREADVRLKDGRVARLRSPRKGDASALLAFLTKLGQESWRNLNHPASFFASITEEAEVDFLALQESHPRRFLISAFSEGAIVGNVGCQVSTSTLAAHCAEVGMGVLAAFEGLGLGSALLGLAIAEAERAGMHNLTLRVRTWNDRAIALYERYGFERVGTLREVARVDGAFVDEHLYQRLGAAPR